MAAIGLELWLPIVKERHRWSDRWREVELPLFPGHLFVKATSTETHKILRSSGVLTLVKEEGKAATLSGIFVTALRDAIARDGVTPEPVTEPAFALGDKEGKLTVCRL